MSDPRQFWDWFLIARSRVERLRDGRDEDVLNEVHKALQRVSPGLWFEIGGPPDGPLQLVVSAAGDADYFADVEKLVDAAPKVEGWEFVAFKPPHGFDFHTEYEGVVVDPAKSWFLPLESNDDPPKFGLRVAVPGYTEELEETYLAAVYIVLETGLGERAAAESIQHVEVGSVPNAPEEDGYIELNELDKYMAWRAR